MLNLGLTDAFRAREPRPGHYTFWDYQAGAWERNNGIRIDHLLLSPQAADRLEDAGIDKAVRGGDKPSDHVPVWVDWRPDRSGARSRKRSAHQVRRRGTEWRAVAEPGAGVTCQSGLHERRGFQTGRAIARQPSSGIERV